MLFCPNCGYRNKTTYNFCRKCGTRIKFSIEDIKPIKKLPLEYQINEFITLKLENNKTVIYVRDEKFLQCKYLLIEIPKENIREFDIFTSIDDISENLDHSLENDLSINKIKPEVEFWGHCSNLQAWSENLYDTNLLHSNLAFPLLKKLTDVGDPNARKVFKDEIAERLMKIYTNVSQYLIQENYLEYFNNEEYDSLMEILIEKIKQKFIKKQGINLEESEVDALFSIIKVNQKHTIAFLINQLKDIGKIDKDTNFGFSTKNKNIIALGFNRIGLKELPSSIGDFTNLVRLYLTENRLEIFPSSLSNLKMLKILDLSDNHLTRLPDEIGYLGNLNELYLNHNIIHKLPYSITKLKNLEILSIWGNQLTSLPQDMHQMGSLRILGASFNQLEKFPKIIDEFPKLEILDLSNNKIEIIPMEIKHLEHLKVLWLSNNPISKIPESLAEIQSLTDLYLVNTPIGTKKNILNLNLFFNLKDKGVNIWI
ncbi:MAG: zinc-ribbon domain-containing protein [Candidatus Thorarchaeota archaeon]